MTKDQIRLAVLKSYVMWAWISNQKKQGINSTKRAYAHLRFGLLEYYGHHYMCSLCESCGVISGLSSETNIVRCAYCPMFNRWPCNTKPNENYTLIYCFLNNSAYTEWQWLQGKHQDKKSQRLAGDVAAALWQRYKELEDT